MLPFIVRHSSLLLVVCQDFWDEFIANLSYRKFFSDNTVHYHFINAKLICDHARTKSRNWIRHFTNTLHVVFDFWRPWSSFTLSRPSLKSLCYLKITVCDMFLSLNTWQNTSNVCYFFSSTRNFMAYCRSIVLCILRYHRITRQRCTDNTVLLERTFAGDWHSASF